MKFFTAALTLLFVVPALGAGSFSYDPDSDKAPAAWGSLDIEGNQCGGSKQSGIDVPTSSCDVRDEYIFAPGSCTLDDLIFTLNDHVIVATYDPDSACVKPRMTIPGKSNPYDALQFHLHSGSDHAIDGRYFGACLHLVHKEVGGEGFSVLGFLLEPTSPDGVPKFSDLLEEWESVESEVATECAVGGSTANSTSQQGGGRQLTSKKNDRALSRAFNPYELIPAGASMYTYEGSLTTPPCSEVVFWNLIDTPISVSVREYLRLTNLILDYVSPDTCQPATVASPSGFTGRPVQKINGREINRICSVDLEDPLEVKSEPTVTPASPAFLPSVMAAAGLSAVAAILL